jgi:hypothetical protein
MTTLSTRHEISIRFSRLEDASLLLGATTVQLPWRARIHFPLFLTDYFKVNCFVSGRGVLGVGAETDRFLLSAEDSRSFGKTFARYHGGANVSTLHIPACKSEVGSLDKVSVIIRTAFRLCRGFSFRARPPSPGGLTSRIDLVSSAVLLRALLGSLSQSI